MLCATSVGGHPVARTIDGLVATALWLRDAEPTFLLCDGALPACELCSYSELPNLDAFVRDGPQPRLCGPCFAAGAASYAPLPFSLHRYGDFVQPDEVASALAEASHLSLDECFSFETRGLRLGEQTRASTLRFFGKADLSSEPEELVEAIARRYAAGAVVAATVAERALERIAPDVSSATTVSMCRKALSAKWHEGSACASSTGGLRIATGR